VPDNQNKTRNKHISLILRAGVAIIACILIASKVNFHEVVKDFSGISVPALSIIIIVFIISQIILAFRWWIFMRAWDIHIPFLTALKLAFLGLYFNNFLPGAVGGDLIRAWYVAKHTHKRMPAVISVVVDRILALIGTILIALIALSLAGRKDIFTRQKTSGIIDAISENKTLLFIVAGIAAIISIGIILSPFGRNKLKYIYQKILNHGKNVFYQLFQSGLVFIKKPYLAPLSLILTFILQGLVILSMGMLGKEIGIPANWEVYFVILPVMWVVGSIPVSISGIGIVEGGMIALFTQFGGATVDEATTLALCQRAVWLIASLPGLVIYLSGKHLPANFDQEFSVDEKQTMQ
jgi:uncharacterized protein (TIRG00374 family)